MQTKEGTCPPIRRGTAQKWGHCKTYFSGALFVPPLTFKTLPAPLVTTAMIEAVTGKCQQIVNIIVKPKPADTAH